MYSFMGVNAKAETQEHGAMSVWPVSELDPTILNKLNNLVKYGVNMCLAWDTNSLTIPLLPGDFFRKTSDYI